MLVFLLRVLPPLRPLSPPSRIGKHSFLRLINILRWAERSLADVGKIALSVSKKPHDLVKPIGYPSDIEPKFGAHRMSPLVPVILLAQRQ